MSHKDGGAGDLAQILGRLNAQSDLVQRHLYLMALLDWIRGDAATAQPCLARVDLLLDVLKGRPETQVCLQLWWQQLVLALDGSTLLADHGFASRNALLSEFIERLHMKLLPMSPETTDASELFALALPSAVDAQWIAALPDATLLRLADLLHAPAHRHHARLTPDLSYWQCTLLDALAFCTSQVQAAGFSPEIRLRISASEQEASPFHTLSSDLLALREAWLAGRIPMWQRNSSRPNWSLVGISLPPSIPI